MNPSPYKSRSELKFLARTQMSGRLGLLIGAVLVPTLISFLINLILPGTDGTSTLSYAVDYAVTFILQIILSVLNVGTTLIFLKCACNMPARIGELFHGYKNNLSAALKIGLLFVLIESVCMIPFEFVSPQLIDAYSLMQQITEASTVSEITALYNEFYSIMGTFYGTLFICCLAAFLIKLAFMPAYYLLLDFPDWSAGKIIKKSVEIMRGNILRYLLLQLSFIPLFILSMFTFGIALIWVLPYMHMANANFYLDMMAVRNKSINTDKNPYH